MIPGFNPDPSICRVGDDYYVVTSTFEFFPAFPIYHSRDLVNWEHVGNVLDRPSQMNLDDVGPSDGLFSPTIRYCDGIFYITFTLLKYAPQQKISNYVVAANRATGPWSAPVCITNEPVWRIDSSLFFDNDGKTYFMANSKVDEVEVKRRILLQEIDVQSMDLVGPIVEIGRGAFPGSAMAEGPHIYRRGGYYYLLIAEGGTGWTHAVTISRSDNVMGPYVQCPFNPILTHKDMTKQDVDSGEIYGVGHADLVEATDGQWWMVMLGRRGNGVLGRETSLTPIEWNDDGWPVVNPGVGRVRTIETMPRLAESSNRVASERDEWDTKELKPYWMFIRVPSDKFWSMKARPGFLRLSLKPATVNTPPKRESPAFISQRVRSQDFCITTRIEFAPETNTENAGLLLRRGKNNIALVKSRCGNAGVIRVVMEDKDGRQVLGEAACQLVDEGIYLRIACKNETRLRFFFSTGGVRWTNIGREIDAAMLGNDAPGGEYTGTTAGVYATSNGKSTRNHADFDFFEMHAGAGP